MSNVSLVFGGQLAWNRYESEFDWANRVCSCDTAVYSFYHVDLFTYPRPLCSRWYNAGHVGRGDEATRAVPVARQRVLEVRVRENIVDQGHEQPARLALVDTELAKGLHRLKREYDSAVSSP